MNTAVAIAGIALQGLGCWFLSLAVTATDREPFAIYVGEGIAFLLLGTIALMWAVYP